MKELNIKLGHKMSESPIAVSVSSDDLMHYPTFHYEGEKHLKLPGKEGVMLIRYCKTSNSEHTNSEGDTRYSCTIEVKEIISAKSDEYDEAGGRDRETEDALDKLVKEKLKAKAKAGNSDEEDEY